MPGLRDDLGQILVDAGALARRLTVSSVTAKAELDYLTNVDREVDDQLLDSLRRLTPGVPVLSEERPLDLDHGDDCFWIVDPIDGTHNLMAGIPLYAVCAALVRDGRTEIAGVLSVATGELYLAERGSGATLDGSPLSVPRDPSSLIAVSSGALDAFTDHPGVYRQLRASGKLRNLGCQSLHLCHVARGQFGFALSAEARLWDDAAGQLIAREAGAIYRCFAAKDPAQEWTLALAGQPLRSLCAHPNTEQAATRIATALWRN